MTNSLIAQKPASAMAKDKACQCLSAQDLKNLEGKALEAAGDSCLEAAFWPHITGLMKEFELAASDFDSLFVISRQLGQELALQCPAYASYARRVAMGDLDISAGDRERESGILVGFNAKAVPPYFTLLDSSGHKSDFYWLREFDGSARFFNGVSDYQLIEMEIIWQYTELFDPSTKSYKTYPEIILMEEIRTLSEEEKTEIYLSKDKTPTKKKRQRKSKK